ncbi:MAG: MlaD family protein [Dysgonamonadaceae bacterium]|jgi:phospholipid/cholesterol/gamma-HCH transport system substrate-binding protein|nr:MlaD family protein [Dysgonamonadaceae bacterium]
MKKLFTKEAITGLITVVSLCILYFGVNYLKGVNLFKPTNHYYVLMTDVSELQTSSPIYVDGFKVGVVNKINFGFDKPPYSIVVLVSLDEKMKIPVGSYFELKSGLTTGAYLNLEMNRLVGSCYQIGDTIEGFSEAGIMDKVSSMIPGIEMLLPRLDSIMAGIQKIVNHPALSQSLDNIESTTASLQKSSRQLNAMLSNDIPSIVKDMKIISSNFVDVSANLKTIDLDATKAKVDEAVNNINKMSIQLNSTDNSMGLLLNDRSLYDNLNTTSKNAVELLNDFKEHPKKYIHFSVF